MEEQILLDNDFARVSYNAERKLGRVFWKQTPDVEEYKSTFMCLYHFACKHPVDNFLSDIRQQGVVPMQARKWFERTMIPDAINVGLKRAAVIIDGSIFKKYYMNLIIGASHKFGLPLKVFLSEQKALEWIDSFLTRPENNLTHRL